MDGHNKGPCPSVGIKLTRSRDLGIKGSDQNKMLETVKNSVSLFFSTLVSIKIQWLV